MTYENPWTFNNIIFDEEHIKDNIGFVYLITNLDNNRKYIGKKQFEFNRKNKGKKSKKPSDWKTYYGSCQELTEDINKSNKNRFKREILFLLKTKRDLTYIEAKEQFLRRVLELPEYYNTNILGKFFLKDKTKLISFDENIQTQHENFIKKSNDPTWRMGDKNVSKRPEVRKKISEAKKGKKHHNYGKKMTKKVANAIKKATVKPITNGIKIWKTKTSCWKELGGKWCNFEKRIKNGELWYIK